MSMQAVKEKRRGINLSFFHGKKQQLFSSILKHLKIVKIKFLTMKHDLWKTYILSITLICFLIVIVLWFFSPAIKARNIKISSPLPDFLTFTKNEQVSTLDLFLPKILGIKTEKLTPPIISAKSAIVYEVNSEKTFYEKNISEKLPMASLTKVMTAIISLENKREDDTYSVLRSDLVGENSMGLTEGEVISLEDLLYGLVLVSGNDAAEVLARNTFSNRERFVSAMNEKAKALGLTNTNFTNPSGLQGDGNQFTTAYDLMVITNYALSKFPLFKKVSETTEHIIAQTDTHKMFYLENETNLLRSYKGVKGVKTGYTPEAGLCLITYLEHENHKIIGVILGSNNRRDEMRELLDYSLMIVDK